MSTEILTKYAQKHIGAFIGCAIGFVSAGAVYANLTSEVHRNTTHVIEHEQTLDSYGLSLARIEIHLENLIKLQDSKKDH